MPKSSSSAQRYSKLPGSEAQQAAPDAPMPAADVVERMYSDVLDETLTPPEIKQRLVELQSLENKWKFIQVHKPLVVSGKGPAWGERENSLLKSLDTAKNPDMQSILQMKVWISSATREVMSAFLDRGGVRVILKLILQRVNKKPLDEIDAVILYELLLCCKLLMNNSVGMKGFLDVSGAIDTIALCLRFEYKLLALMVLEILSACCYSESSTALVIHGMRVLAKNNLEPPFACLSYAVINEDVEVKASILQFVNILMLNADLDSHSLLRSNLTSCLFDERCEEAMLQIDGELEVVEVEGSGNQRLSVARSNSPKKVLNVDKLGENVLVALRGVRSTSMRGVNLNSSSAALSAPDRASTTARTNTAAKSTKKGKLMNLDGDEIDHHDGILITTELSAGCLGSVVLSDHRWYSISSEYIRRHAGQTHESRPENFIAIHAIKDVRLYTTDASMLEMASKNKFHVFEVVLDNGTQSFAVDSVGDRDTWVQSIQALRDAQNYSKSTYYMQRTYLELKFALQCAEKYRKLYDEFSSFIREEKQFTMENCGIDINNVQDVFQFLYKELVAAGMETVLLSIMQEMLLVPAESYVLWNAIHVGIRNLRRVQRRSQGVLDIAFNELSVREMLKRKVDQEGTAYKQMSKLAMSAMASEREVLALKSKLRETEKDMQQSMEASSKELRARLETESAAGEAKAEINRLNIAVTELQSLNEKLQKESTALKTGGVLHVGSRESGEQMTKILADAVVRKRVEELGLADVLSSPLLGDAPPVVTVDERFAKFEKMKKMLPEGAVRQKMGLEGFKEQEIEDFFTGKLTAEPAKAKTAPIVDERLAKFVKMKSMLPEGAVRQKMSMEGFTSAEIDRFFDEQTLPAPAKEDVEELAAKQVVDERFEKFVKMKKMLPEGAVRQKMSMEGFSAAEIDTFFAVGTVGDATKPQEEVSDPLEKYRKMQKMLPADAVRQKMHMDGVRPEDISVFFGEGDSHPVQPKVFEKYERMRKMLPEEAIRNKMIMDGCSQEDINKFFVSTSKDSTDSAAASHAASKPVNGSGIKLKNLFWNKLGDADVKHTVWERMAQFEIDKTFSKQIEEWFAAKAATVQVHKEAISASTSPKLLSVLDSKRTQNVLIVMGKLRKLPEEVMNMIVTLDCIVLTHDITQSLISILPNAEEITAIKAHLTPDKLDNASKLYFHLCRIPRLSLRLECHEVAFSWHSYAQDVHTKLAVLHAANQEFLKSQSSFDNILSLILSVGNFINGSSRFGQAVGVKLDTLNKLVTLKANEAGKGTLMNFLALIAESHSPELVKFSESWIAIWAAADMSMKELVTEVNQLEAQVLKLQQEHLRIKDATAAIIGLDGSTEDIKGYCTQPLYQRLEGFLNVARPRLTFIKNELRTVESQLESSMARYAENYRAAVDEDSCKRFYSTLANFGRCFIAAHEHNVKKRLAALRAQKLAAQANAKLEAKAKGLSQSIKADDKAVVLDHAQPVENIFGRLHSLQDESSESVIGKFKRKLLQSMRITGLNFDSIAGQEEEA